VRASVGNYPAYLRGRRRLRCKDGEELSLGCVAGEVELDGERLYISIGRAEFDGYTAFASPVTRWEDELRPTRLVKVDRGLYERRRYG
jgi:hypothetical protein